MNLLSNSPEVLISLRLVTFYVSSPTVTKIMSEAELRQRNRKDLEDLEYQKDLQHLEHQDEDTAKIIQKVHVSREINRKIPLRNESFQDDDDEVDVDAYTSKKTMSQGLFDMTLFTRNATLLKHLIDQGSDKSSYFYFLVPLILAALIVQVLIYTSEASY